MPLIKSKSEQALKANIRTLSGEVGSSPHVASHRQALAIAFDIKRRAKAAGGAVHEGPIVSSVPGRTDKHPLDVASGSYIVPAHVVSGLGQGNTMAGIEHLHKMFPDRHAAKRAFGGHTEGSPAVPIMAAGGEVCITPEQIIAKYGSLKRGHKMLDDFCKKYTKKLAKQISNLPGPARD